MLCPSRFSHFRHIARPLLVARLPVRKHCTTSHGGSTTSHGEKDRTAAIERLPTEEQSHNSLTTQQQSHNLGRKPLRRGRLSGSGFRGSRSRTDAESAAPETVVSQHDRRTRDPVSLTPSQRATRVGRQGLCLAGLCGSGAGVRAHTPHNSLRSCRFGIGPGA